MVLCSNKVIGTKSGCPKMAIEEAAMNVIGQLVNTCSGIGTIVHSSNVVSNHALEC
jgi:hypothetical protein